MGFDINRFQGVVDEELICPICSCVLEEPVQAPDCEHAFCDACINQWLQQQQTCPVDRLPMYPKDLKPVPRILKNLLSKLQISCDNSLHGCEQILKLESLVIHLNECDYNPKKPIECSHGCGTVVAKDELQNHNCIKELRKIINDQQMKIDYLTNDLSKYKIDMDSLNGELRTLKECMRALRTSNPNVKTYLDHVENDEIVRWASSLPVARVTRWGGMISTPDAVLQAVIKRALAESNCPPNIINLLMERAHEKYWPPGLCTLETRQMNRRHYESFVCKRIPSKQAVVVMACDNRHVEPHLIVEPGMVMIFAHGVES